MFTRSFNYGIDEAISEGAFSVHTPPHTTRSGNVTMTFVAPCDALPDVPEVKEISPEQRAQHPGVIMPVFMEGEVSVDNPNFDSDGARLVDISIYDYARRGGMYFCADRVTLRDGAGTTATLSTK